MRTRSTLLSVLTLSLVGTAAAEDFAKYQVVSTQLAEHLYLLTGAGGNMAAYVGPDGVLLVDDDFEAMNEKLRAAVTGISEKPVRFVVITHWHFDHVGGNEALARTGALIIAHENVRKRMAAGQLITLIDQQIPPASAEALPVITMTDSLTIRVGDEDVVVFHVPRAHTDGDAVVLFRKANVIHAGDIFFNCGYPFIDISSGGTIDGMIAAADTILKLSDEKTRIIPGHGLVTDRAGLEIYAQLLRDFREAIAREIASGKSLEEIRAAKPTAALDERWGKVFFPPEMFTEVVFRSLKREP